MFSPVSAAGRGLANASSRAATLKMEPRRPRRGISEERGGGAPPPSPSPPENRGSVWLRIMRVEDFAALVDDLHAQGGPGVDHDAQESTVLLRRDVLLVDEALRVGRALGA